MSTPANLKKEIDGVTQALTTWASGKSSAVRLQVSMVVMQLHAYANGNEKYRAALTPGIVDSIRLLEQARCGR